VSTAIAGIPEVVRDGETGLVIPVDDESALVHALRTLVERPELRRQLGGQARALVGREFNAEANTRGLADLLACVARREDVRA
jgi:glycosyltransferase involved in cell wall biosynthesis